MLSRIQSILNNTSFSTIGKTPNKITYGFSSHRPLDLLSDLLLPNTFQARTDAVDAISFALANQKAYYNRNHQPPFMKVGDCAMLKLHKDYSIPSSVRVTKKLMQQYIGPFRVVERVGRLAYNLNVLDDWRIHPVFFVAQLKPASCPTEDLFGRLRLQQPLFVFVEGNIDHHKSFKIERLLNKRTVRKCKGLAIEYFVHWTGYRPE